MADSKIAEARDLESKIDKMRRLRDLDAYISTPVTLQAKQKSLPISEEFEYEKANPFNSGVNSPTRFDLEMASCVVRGTIPPEIDGTFYRVTCDPIFANRNKKDIWINGDGAVDAWQISNGVVDFKQKYVRTPRFVIERAARRSLFGIYRNPFAGDERVFDEIQSPGNMHIHYWQGVLLACKEDSPPIAMDPDTLDTIGIYDFDGQMTAKTYTAHPKVDVLTGETMAYGMEATGLGSNDLAYYRFNKEGKKVDECWLKTPIVTWTHDMGATDNWVIFVQTPFQIDLEYMKKEAGTHFRFNRFLPNTFGVLPRRNPKSQDVRWFTTLKNHFFGHLANHFEGEDGCIYLDTFLADGATLNVFPNMHPELDSGKPERQIKGKFVRFKIDPHAESTELELPVVLSDIVGEMPRCDDRFTTKPYNNAFGTRFTPKGFDAVLHIDIAAGLTHVWEAGEGVSVGEPCFVPRAKDSPEGDGYLVVCVRDINTRLASLVILDATNITAGPVSIIELPVVLCEGVHGNWVDASELPVRRPLADYSGVTPELLAKFGPGAPKAYDELTGRSVKLVR
ncbi:hypothetical protein N7449_012241 [Penicillium cf. viridicatum]|uniref:Lignostilbene dioxygenase n=1 Tax=Penicillium cf. viridicatum TaxID=2972119 RepID=A0A9W9LYQ5_9EURO|nr:hypothetical protein N7449_012241 [Penicillium cf. viridicatum]